MIHGLTRCRWLLALFVVAAGQMQFEIPAEMLQGMMGGGMMGGGGGRQKAATEWPKSENSEVAPEFDWLVNTEWKGKTATYMLLRDGNVESSLKECEQEGQCLWAANAGRVLINTPTLKVVKFTVEGLKGADQKKLDEKAESELKKITFVSEKAGKSGKKSELSFSKLAEADTSENIIARDLFEILDVPEDADAAAVKSSFRRLSVKNHPDKGGDPNVFAEIREAYETLSDQDSKRYYTLGGMQLVKNIELGYKEAEAQKGQLDAQLTKVPKNHPQYQMYKQQVEGQKKQFEKANMKHDLEKKMRSDDTEVFVPISAEELYNGVAAKTFEYKRLMLCRGCRADPTTAKCQDCGRCPPEKVQVPKYGMTPFGKQVVGMSEKERESRERCREVVVPISGLRVPKGAKAGSTLKNMADLGHQTAGKLPGRVVLKVQHGSPNDLYTIADIDLHTVLSISLEQALFGFTVSWSHLGDQKVTISRTRVTQPNEVVRFKKKGIVGEGGARGNLYVRIKMDIAEIAGGSKSLTLKAPENAGELNAQLSKEGDVELREGSAWRRWTEREVASAGIEKEDKAKGDKTEL